MALSTTNALATADTSALDITGAALRARAQQDPKSAIQVAAKQFEAMFMQQLLKSMRDSSMNSGLLDNAGSQMGTEMLDGQLANKISGAKGGLADVIARQLERQMGTTSGTTSAPTASARAALPAAAAAGAAGGTGSVTGASLKQEEFLRLHQASAAGAEAQTGIPAAFMVAQAAHESGWGKREIRNADGSTSYNLFGIKAGSSWTGRTTDITTTEVVDGQAKKVVQKFRAYASYDESFRDYAQMMKDSPRYAKAVASSTTAEGFAKGLQRAGYATDPAYADKLTRTINTTLRLQRAVASRAPDSVA